MTRAEVDPARRRAPMTAVLVGQPWCGREPRQWQTDAVSAVSAAFGRGLHRPLVHAATGSGKSLLLAEMCGRTKGRILLTTPTQALVQQLAGTVTERCPGEVGMAYQHRWDTDRRIVVTCNASLGGVLEEQHAWALWLGDEAHRLEADVLRALRPTTSYAVGLTATPFRADARGLQAWDDLVFSYTSAEAVRDGVLVPWRVVRWDGRGVADVDQIVAAWVAAADGPGIVSALTIEDAEKYATLLGARAAAIHGKLKPAEQAARIERLRNGQLSCLVHVQLLTEGVDLPWLRWLALRRPVGSAVRLVQEVGRVLRAAPGKTEAVLYDPHDLLGRLGLVHAAALEDAQREEVDEKETEISELSGLGSDVAKMPPPVAVNYLSGWVTDVLGTLRGAGLSPPPEFGEGPWRQDRASTRQVDALRRMEWAIRYWPDPAARKAIRWILSQPTMRRGTASDLLSIFRTFADASGNDRAERRHWHCPVELPHPSKVSE